MYCVHARPARRESPWGSVFVPFATGRQGRLANRCLCLRRTMRNRKRDNADLAKKNPTPRAHARFLREVALHLFFLCSKAQCNAAAWGWAGAAESRMPWLSALNLGGVDVCTLEASSLNHVPVLAPDYPLPCGLLA